MMSRWFDIDIDEDMMSRWFDIDIDEDMFGGWNEWEVVVLVVSYLWIGRS